MPLGEAYSGTCRARPNEFHVPPEAHLREACNCGYARAGCDRFPEGSAADAVRFSLAELNGGKLGVIYVLEKDHAPVSHGTLEFLVEADAFANADLDALLLRQARAFVRTYLATRAV